MKKSTLLTTKEAIEMRRSIRKYRPNPISDECISELLESARLAPSGCNAQPWRFKIVKEQEIKQQLAQAAYAQMFIAEAPVVIVCCADIEGYIDGTVSGAQDLGKIRAIENRIVDILVHRANEIRSYTLDQIGSLIAANVAIAIEHIILRALDFGLGTCWIRLVESTKVNRIFGWSDNIFVVALLPIGYPAEAPEPRKRLPLKSILIK
jgi:nitroreductase